jgi:dual specificity MAP kinase phosphatase
MVIHNTFSSGGISRSPAVVIAYLMKTNNWDLQTAHLFVKERRSGIKISDGLLQQLHHFEQEIANSKKIPIVEKEP